MGQYTIGPKLGGYASIPLTNMKSGPASFADANHIDSEMWVQLDSSGNHYIEAGILDGFERPDNYHYCFTSLHQCEYYSFEPGNGGSSTCVVSGCGAYELFWADTSVAGGTQYQYLHVVRFLSPNPGAREYIRIYYSGGGDWVISLSGAYTYTGISTIESAYHQTKYVVWGGEYEGPKNNGECGALAAIGAEVIGTNGALIPVEMATRELDPPFTGTGYLSEWDWSLPGSC